MAVDRLIATLAYNYDVDSAYASQVERGWEVVVWKDDRRCSCTANDPQAAFEEACRRLNIRPEPPPPPPPKRRSMRELIRSLIG